MPGRAFGGQVTINCCPAMVRVRGELLPPSHSLGDGHHIRRPAIGTLRVGDAGYVGTVGRSVSGPATGSAWSTTVAALSIRPVGRIVDGDRDLQRLSRPGVGRAADLHYAIAGVDLKFFPGHDIIGHRDAKDGCVAPDALSSGTTRVDGAVGAAATLGAGIAAVGTQRRKPPAQSSAACLAFPSAGSAVRPLPLLFAEQRQLSDLASAFDRND